MRIGINATSLNDRPSGARQRFIGLYGATFEANPDNEYLIYEPRDCRIATWFAHLPNVRGQATPLPSEGRWQRFLGGLGYWRRQLRRDKLDLFEALHLPLISAPDCPTLLTVHDARPVRRDIPEFRRRFYKQILRRSLRKADHVVTVSGTMRAELLRIEPSSTITTIYNGINPELFKSRATDGLASTLPAAYLLAVGHFEWRKNYSALLKAITLLRTRQPHLNLVIVGNDGGTLADINDLIEELGLGSIVRLMSGLDDAALAALYRDAQALVFPSTYEGFGIPVLEAMAAGCPLVLSNLAVFREITEGRAMFFEPLEPAAIADAISELLASGPRQEQQRAYGRSRIKAFEFTTLAAQLDHLHHQLVARIPPSNGHPAFHVSRGTNAESSLKLDRTVPSEHRHDEPSIRDD